IDSEFLREKSEDESSRGVLDEDDPLEAVLIVGRERDDELLDGRVDAAEERHAQQQGFCLLQQPLADDIGRDRADEEDGNGRGQDAEARHFAAEILDIDRPDESVNEAEQPEQRRNGNEQRDGDEETGDETSTEPLHNQSKTTPINDDAKSAVQNYRSRRNLKRTRCPLEPPHREGRDQDDAGENSIPGKRHEAGSPDDRAKRFHDERGGDERHEESNRD